jgi:hypothetical protein
MKCGSLKKKSFGMLGIAVASAAGLGIAPAANAATPAVKVRQWHVIKSVNEGRTLFTAVVATGPASGWAFASRATGTPVAYERTGATTWKTFSFPTGKGDTIAAAQATSASDVWAFGTDPGKTHVYSLLYGKWTLRRSLQGVAFQTDVVSGRDVTVYVPHAVYHFDGASWTKAADSITDGYALSASDGWTYSGTTVTHVDGKSRTTYDLASLLPAKTELDGPRVAAVYAVSDHNIYVIGNGETQDAGGPVVVLHYEGHTWTKLAGNGPGNPRGVTPDGSGGLWIPVSWAGGGTILHFSGGRLAVTVPVDKSESLYVNDVSQIPGTANALAVANTASSQGEILQYS